MQRGFFMRGGKQTNASRGQVGGSGAVSSRLLTPKIEASALRASLTPAMDAAAPTQAATQAAKQTDLAQLAAKQTATAKQLAAKQAAAKQAEAKQAAAKQTTTKQAAVRQEESVRLEAERHESERLEAERQESARLEAVRHESERLEAERQESTGHGEDGRTELIPNVFWFTKPVVAAGVTDSFKAHYNFPYMNWTEVPETVRDRWFKEFKREFTWKAEYDDMVRRDYEKKGLERLKDHVNKAAKVPLHKRIKWMSETVRAELIRKREDPDFMKRSVRAKKNRYSGQSEISFDPGHRQGSVSTIEVAERLAAKKNGVVPLAADVYEKTHGFEIENGETLLIGDRPNKTMAEYKEKLAEYHDKGVTKTPDEVFLEVVGGRKKGGKVYGLGSASSLFYEAGNSSQTKQPTQSVSIISQLSSQLEECKKMMEESKNIAEDSKKVAENCLKVAQASKEKYEKGTGEWKKEKEELQASMTRMKKAMSEMVQLILKERSFDPHNQLN